MKTVERRWPPSTTFVLVHWVKFQAFSSGQARNRWQQNKLFSGLAPAISPRFRKSAIGIGRSPSRYLIPSGGSSSWAVRNSDSAHIALTTQRFFFAPLEFSELTSSKVFHVEQRPQP